MARLSVAVSVRGPPTARRVEAGNQRPVFLVAFRVFVDGAHHRRPRLFDDEESALAWAHGMAFLIDYIGLDAGQPLAGRARFGGVGGHGRNHELAGFGLPPRIHDRRPLVPYVLV